jgi:hypothetical protein
MSSPAKENPANGDGGVKTPSSVRAIDRARDRDARGGLNRDGDAAV